MRENHQPRAESQQIVPNGTLLSTTPRQVLESSTGDSRLWYRQEVVWKRPQGTGTSLARPRCFSRVCRVGWMIGKRTWIQIPGIIHPTTKGGDTTRTNKLSSVAVTRRASTLEAFRYESTDVASWHWPFDQPLNHMSGPAVPLVLSGTSVATPS